MGFKVFYAWQSDRDQDHCRYLIREATKRATKKLAQEIRVSDAPSLDHDTKGEPGTPHIADTIKRKIRDCGVFLADLTPVCRYETADDPPRVKYTPNANVLIELGLAIRSVGWNRILLVFNTAYGSFDDIPFDLKHHSRPITYQMGKDDDADAARDGLTSTIKSKLTEIIKSGIIEESRNRTMSVKVETVHDEREGQQHARHLLVDIFNKGPDLNNVYAVLTYPGKDGKLQTYELQRSNAVPEPFKTHFSFRFTVPNYEPHKALEALEGIAPDQINVVVYSNVREVARIPATRWLEHLEAFRKADLSLPGKPPPPSPRRSNPNPLDYLRNRPRPSWLDER